MHGHIIINYFATKVLLEKLLFTLALKRVSQWKFKINDSNFQLTTVSPWEIKIKKIIDITESGRKQQRSWAKNMQNFCKID